MIESLKNINLNTLLIYPPEKIENGKYFTNGIPYGIALLRGFLELNGYNGARTVGFYGSQPLSDCLWGSDIFDSIDKKSRVFNDRYQKSDCLFESGQEYLNIVPIYDNFKHCYMPVRI